MKEFTNIYELLPSLVAIICGLAVGIIFEKVVISKFKQFKNPWFHEERLLRVLRGKMMYLFIIAGLYGASLNLLTNPVYLQLSTKILVVAAIFILTIMTSQATVGLIDLYTHKQIEAGLLPSLSIFTNLARILVLAIGILVALQSLGIAIAPILTALGVGGLAAALALQDTLSNLFSGLQLIASGQFRPGNYIRLNSGEEGTITDITWRSTTIQTRQNNLVIVPNGVLARAIITNFHQPSADLTIAFETMVAYGSDLEQVEQIIQEVVNGVLQDVPGGVVGVEPKVSFKEFVDQGIKLIVSVQVQDFSAQFPIRNQFYKRLYERFQIEGIKLPFSFRNVYVKDQVQK